MLSRRTAIRCCYVVGFLDLFAVGMFFPLFNRRGRQLGASPSVVGLIGSIYGALQLFSSPYMGKASDTWGRKPILLLSCLGCFAGYLIMGVTDTILFYALARLPTGILKHSQTSAKAYLSDITLPEERPGIMGRFNAVGSMGFIIAPIIGGSVAMQENGFFKVSLLTCSVYVVTFFFVWFTFDKKVVKKHMQNIGKEFPEPNEIVDKSSGNLSDTLQSHNAGSEDLNKYKHSSAPENTEKNSTEESRKEEQDGMHAFFSFVRIKSVRNVMDLLLIRFVMGFSMMIYRSNYTAMLDYRYGVDAKTTGYTISFGSVVGAISGMSVGEIYNYFESDAKMMLFGGLLMTLSLFGISLSPSIFGILLCVIPLSVSSAIMRVNFLNLTLKHSQADEKGAVMGVGDSMISVARMLSPAVAGFAQEVSVVGPCWMATGLAMVGVLLMGFFLQDEPINDESKKKD